MGTSPKKYKVGDIVKHKILEAYPEDVSPLIIVDIDRIRPLAYLCRYYSFFHRKFFEIRCSVYEFE